MSQEARLWDAISEEVSAVVPEEDGQTLVGDYVTVAEVMVEDGRIGVAVLTPEATPRHVVLLARAIAQMAESVQEAEADKSIAGGESDAA